MQRLCRSELGSTFQHLNMIVNTVDLLWPLSQLRLSGISGKLSAVGEVRVSTPLPPMAGGRGSKVGNRRMLTQTNTSRREFWTLCGNEGRCPVLLGRMTAPSGTWGCSTA